MNTVVERITIDPEVCLGKPVIRGMRWPAEVILDMMGSGMTHEEIIEDHPELTREDLQACLQFARLSVSGEVYQLAN